MMKRTFWIFAILTLGLTAQVFAVDHAGRLGLNYLVGPSFIVGGDGATDVSGVEPGVGAGLQLGFSPNLDFRFDYDYIDAALHSQAITFGGQWNFQPGQVISPFAGAGIGFGKPFANEGWDHFSLKLNGGLEKEISQDISLSALIGYQYIDGTEPFGSIHVIEPGIRLTYFFGTFQR